MKPSDDEKRDKCGKFVKGTKPGPGRRPVPEYVRHIQPYSRDVWVRMLSMYSGLTAKEAKKIVDDPDKPLLDKA